MVLLGRIELPTSALPRMRSTTELQQLDHSADRGAADRPRQARALAAPPRFVNAKGLNGSPPGDTLRAMPKTPSDPTREARLAAQLRANLHRRKAQARAIAEGSAEETAALPSPLPKAPGDR